MCCLTIYGGGVAVARASKLEQPISILRSVKGVTRGLDSLSDPTHSRREQMAYNPTHAASNRHEHTLHASNSRPVGTAVNLAGTESESAPHLSKLTQQIQRDRAASCRIRRFGANLAGCDKYLNRRPLTDLFRQLNDGRHRI